MNRTWKFFCKKCGAEEIVKDVLAEETFFGFNFAKQHRNEYESKLETYLHNVEYIRGLSHEDQESYIPWLAPSEKVKSE